MLRREGGRDESSGKRDSWRQRLTASAFHRDLSLALTMVAIGAIGMATPATAATAYDGVTVIAFGNDRWYNYDFNSQSASASNVDWAVTLIFRNNATINKVKSRMDDWTDLSFSSSETKHGRVSNYYDNWQWDGDSGKKRPLCPAWAMARHYRVYAPVTSYDRESMYNSTLGYYVIGTTHKDWDECGGSKRHGFSEDVEQYVKNEVQDNTSIQNDYWNIYNNEPYRVQGNHTWENNSWATTVNIP